MTSSSSSSGGHTHRVHHNPLSAEQLEDSLRRAVDYSTQPTLAHLYLSSLEHLRQTQAAVKRGGQRWHPDHPELAALGQDHTLAWTASLTLLLTVACGQGHVNDDGLVSVIDRMITRDLDDLADPAWRVLLEDATLHTPQGGQVTLSGTVLMIQAERPSLPSAKMPPYTEGQRFSAPLMSYNTQDKQYNCRTESACFHAVARGNVTVTRHAPPPHDATPQPTA